MINELKGRQWFAKQVKRVFIATAIITLLSMNESLVELIVGWFGL